MPLRVDVKPALLRWACARSVHSAAELEERFPKLVGWMTGVARPTFKQLESFSKATRTPLGYLFLATPPSAPIPIPDLRTIANASRMEASPDLLDTVYICQRRQAWYRDHIRSVGGNALEFVGSATVSDSAELTAARIRKALGLDFGARRGLTRGAAQTAFVQRAEALGVLVMVNGVVGGNTHRKLDPEEFRGFALVDDLAPLVFVNGADSKAAQAFTLAHELAHVWLGESALSNATPAPTEVVEVERWCNAVAAELLAPLEQIKAEVRPGDGVVANAERLSRRFKVSTLVILRRLLDAGFLAPAEFWVYFNEEVQRLRGLPRKKSSGGDFYPTQTARVGKRFASAVIVQAREGRTTFREAFRLLGVKKVATFDRLASHLELV